MTVTDILLVLAGISLTGSVLVFFFLRGARDDNNMGDEAAHPSRFINEMENTHVRS